MGKILRKLKIIYNIVLIKIQERCKYGVKYLYFKKNSDTLIIVFSAFPPTNFRLYNYIKSFKNLPFDRLYVKDIWGYKGSYYLMEDGSLFPFEQTLKLIQEITSWVGYKKVYTAGTSKGGSAAIIYGMKLRADAIFTGACQYYIGNYLNIPVHFPILKKMLGENIKDEQIEYLNNLICNMIQNKVSHDSVFHIIYSWKDHTHAVHTKTLIDDLKKNGYKVIEKDGKFNHHNDVGKAFVPYIISCFTNKN